MLRPFLLVTLLTLIRSAYVTDPPTFADRLDRLYEKVEKFTIGPAKKTNSKLYAKLDRLNSLTPDRNRDLSDDDDELLSAMKLWGSMSDEQLRGLVQEIQQMKDEDRSDRLTDGDYDGDWPDDDQDRDNEDYNNDGEEWDPLEEEAGSTSHPIVGVTPSAFTRLDTRDSIDYIDPIAATNERPRILDDSHATPKERMSLRKTAFENVREVFRSNGCLVPQPRWLYLRNLAPAADTLYVPPCVKLHRCAPDACCCRDERQECAPVDGKYVAIPVYLGKANHNLTVARMLFFNHTRCSCIYRESIESTVRSKIDFREERRDELLARRESVIRERQNDWRAPTEEPKLERDEEQTSPPQLRRCTCPTLFRNRIKDGICSCVCDWPDTTRKRDCLSLARGKEHFGLRDRVCVAQGDCAMPSCEHGPYERSAGRCPYKRVKRRYHSRRYQDKV